MPLCPTCEGEGVCILARIQREESDKRVAGILHPENSQRVVPVDSMILGVAAAMLECTIFEAPPLVSE